MRISVITISLDQGRFLEQTLRSIVHQSEPPDELIVVDGGSTDRTPAILDSFKDDIDRLLVGVDTGPANALNVGLRETSGDVVVCINAGDGLLEHALARVRSRLREIQGPFVLFGNGIAIDEQDRPLRPFLSTKLTARRYVGGGSVVLHQATFYDRRALVGLGGFNEDNRVSWDGELIARADHAGVPIIRVPDRLGVIRIHEGAISRTATTSEPGRRNQRELFIDVMGRPPRRTDGLMRHYYRIEKHLANPRYATRRAMAAAGLVEREAWPWWDRPERDSQTPPSALPDHDGAPVSRVVAP